MTQPKSVWAVGPFLLVIGPSSSGNQWSLFLDASWSSPIGCRTSCRPTTGAKFGWVIPVNEQMIHQEYAPVSPGRSQSQPYQWWESRLRPTLTRTNCILTCPRLKLCIWDTPLLTQTIHWTLLVLLLTNQGALPPIMRLYWMTSVKGSALFEDLNVKCKRKAPQHSGLLTLHRAYTM